MIRYLERDHIDEKKWDEKVLVASGTPAEKGENGSIEYFFDTESKPKPKALADGRVDYYDIGLVSCVNSLKISTDA